MKTVWKYDIPLIDEFALDIPAHAKILRIEVAAGKPRMWVLLNPEGRLVRRKFIVRGTGHPISHANPDYLGTVFFHEGSLVFHIFEVTHET